MYVLCAIAMLTYGSVLIRTAHVRCSYSHARCKCAQVRREHVFIRSLLADIYQKTHQCSPEIIVAVAGFGMWVRFCRKRPGWLRKTLPGTPPLLRRKSSWSFPYPLLLLVPPLMLTLVSRLAGIHV